MRQNLKLLLYVLIMAIVTSGILMGVEALTAERIQNNKDAKIKIAILEANGIAYSLANINETFEQEIDVIEAGDWTFYVNPDNGSISFTISGNGVWGPIVGILTLESDFETIIKVSILQQEETPGLGGVIADRSYLDTFVGKLMVPTLMINKDPGENLPNEIDTIVGATNTSKRFEELINTDYASAKIAWQSLE